jgi:hypothetical protein
MILDETIHLSVGRFDLITLQEGIPHQATAQKSASPQSQLSTRCRQSGLGYSSMREITPVGQFNLRVALCGWRDRLLAHFNLDWHGCCSARVMKFVADLPFSYVPTSYERSPLSVSGQLLAGVGQ